MRLRTRLWRLSGSRTLERAVGIRGVDSLRDDVAEQLLDVEGVAFGARGEQLDQCLGHVVTVTAELCDLALDELRDVSVRHEVKRQLGEAGKALEAEAPARFDRRPIGDHEQHRQPDGDPRQDLEQVARQLVDPVAVLEDDGERPVGRARAQADRQEILR